ncbi:uncharacterized protein DUF664 [Tamaricihabitans halophyticus]|uniref:Uncharacterized protein DUF664 n=1 Tax=Tamaricihabitans halophyticus TaxID=1262583 RepID=A0A4R2QA12_9PSEU|nr:DinB family protein [Tamaricihabitans halophyticus]TCP45760.1 uncharacterized protein DUF664 [Tamaricihabitans halophyticus]
MTSTTDRATNLDAERGELLAALAEARANLIATTEGLTDEQAAERPTVSALCLGGLLKHVAEGEQQWMSFVTDGPSAMTFELPDGARWADIMAGTAREVPQWMIEYAEGFQLRSGETLAGVVANYERVAARTEKIIAEVPDLSAARRLPAVPWGDSGKMFSIRQVLLHLIAEVAEHAGHADILRETLDHGGKD